MSVCAGVTWKSSQLLRNPPRLFPSHPILHCFWQQASEVRGPRSRGPALCLGPLSAPVPWPPCALPAIIRTWQPDMIPWAPLQPGALERSYAVGGWVPGGPGPPCACHHLGVLPVPPVGSRWEEQLERHDQEDPTVPLARQYIKWFCELNSSWAPHWRPPERSKAWAQNLLVTLGVSKRPPLKT